MQIIKKSFEQLFYAKFGRSPSSEELEAIISKVTIDQRVTSHNQTGGITAHTVNIAPQKRTLTPEMKAQLLSMLPKERTIEVESPIGDGEAIEFAQENWEFLKASGFKMSQDGLIQSIRTPAPKGQSIDLQSNPTAARIMIGHRT